MHGEREREKKKTEARTHTPLQEERSPSEETETQRDCQPENQAFSKVGPVIVWAVLGSNRMLCSQEANERLALQRLQPFCLILAPESLVWMTAILCNAISGSFGAFHTTKHEGLKHSPSVQRLQAFVLRMAGP